jgi:hypothetical protein
VSTFRGDAIQVFLRIDGPVGMKTLRSRVIPDPVNAFHMYDTRFTYLKSNVHGVDLEDTICDGHSERLDAGCSYDHKVSAIGTKIDLQSLCATQMMQHGLIKRWFSLYNS